MEEDCIDRGLRLHEEGKLFNLYHKGELKTCNNCSDCESFLKSDTFMLFTCETCEASNSYRYPSTGFKDNIILINTKTKVSEVLKCFEPISIGSYRLSSEYSKLELDYVMAWREQRYGRSRDILDALMRQTCSKDDKNAEFDWYAVSSYFRYPLGEITKRDEIIAETIIQWLGTNVGSCFVQEVLKSYGRKP